MESQGDAGSSVARLAPSAWLPQLVCVRRVPKQGGQFLLPAWDDRLQEARGETRGGLHGG